MNVASFKLECGKRVKKCPSEARGSQATLCRANFAKMTTARARQEAAMREHQIVISLKPEHFQQVQRMARAEGSKAVSVFVRQRLLSALGLDGQEHASETTSGPDWQHISGQLRRLHRELQVFIAESLTTSQLADGPEPPMFIVPEENFITQGAPILVEYNPAHQLYLEQKQALALQQQQPQEQTPPPPSQSVSAAKEDVFDEMEQLADRAFAISPRLGAIQGVPVQTNKYDPLADLLEEKLVRKATEQEQVDDEEAEEEELDYEDEPAQNVSDPELVGRDQSASVQVEEETLEETALSEHEQTDDYSSASAEIDISDSGTVSSAAAVSSVADEEISLRQSSAIGAGAADDDEATQTHQHINDADDDSADPDSVALPPSPPPFSGGSPPRKRAK
jgi:hypothetical protein